MTDVQIEQEIIIRLSGDEDFEHGHIRLVAKEGRFLIMHNRGFEIIIIDGRNCAKQIADAD